MTFCLIYNQMKYFRSQNIIWKDYLKWGNNIVVGFTKLSDLSLSLCVWFGAAYLQSSTSHQEYKKLMAGENCLKAASCEPEFLSRRKFPRISSWLSWKDRFIMYMVHLDSGLGARGFACICIILSLLSLSRIYNLSPLSQVVQAEPGAQYLPELPKQLLQISQAPETRGPDDKNITTSVF